SLPIDVKKWIRFTVLQSATDEPSSAGEIHPFESELQPLPSPPDGLSRSSCSLDQPSCRHAPYSLSVGLIRNTIEREHRPDDVVLPGPSDQLIQSDDRASRDPRRIGEHLERGTKRTRRARAIHEDTRQPYGHPSRRVCRLFLVVEAARTNGRERRTGRGHRVAAPPEPPDRERLAPLRSRPPSSAPSRMAREFDDVDSPHKANSLPLLHGDSADERHRKRHRHRHPSGRSRSRNRSGEVEKPPSKTNRLFGAASNSLVSIPNKIHLSMLNSGILPVPKAEENRAIAALTNKPVEVENFHKYVAQRRKYPVLLKVEFQCSIPRQVRVDISWQQMRKRGVREKEGTIAHRLLVFQVPS
ncbi:unnamed protein product, partial [Darwinula stevensoni]